MPQRTLTDTNPPPGPDCLVGASGGTTTRDARYPAVRKLRLTTPAPFGASEAYVRAFQRDDVPAGGQIQNCITVATLSPSVACSTISVLYGESFVTQKFRVGDPGVAYAPIPNRPGPTGRPQGPTDIVYGFEFSKGRGNGGDLIDPVISDLLPAELEFVPESEGGTNWQSSDIFNFSNDPSLSLQPGCVNPTFEAIPNYAGLGRTLVRWTYTGCVMKGKSLALPYIYTYVSLRIKPGTPAGTVIRNAATASLAGNAPINDLGCLNYQTPPNDGMDSTVGVRSGDVLDLDGDGFTNDSFCNSFHNDYVVPTLATTESSKWVKGGLDTSWSRYPASGDTTTSGDGRYELFITNSGNTSLSALDLVDVLPWVGDTSVTSPATPRGSQWGEQLVSLDAIERRASDNAAFVSVPAGETVTGFSPSTNPCRWNTNDLEAGQPRLKAAGGTFAVDAGVTAPAGCATGWTTTAAGARSFAVRYTPTTPLAPGASLKLTVTVKVAAGESPSAPVSGKIAWNSFGFAAVTTAAAPNDRLLSTEPIQVGLKMVDTAATASIGDYVWIDENHDGVQNEATGVPGVQVGLYRPGFGPDGIAGNADDANRLDVTLTDVNGRYVFYGLIPTTSTYQVRFDRAGDLTTGPLAGHKLTTVDAAAAGDSADSDATMVGLVPTIVSTPTLAAGTHTPTYDFGFWQPASLGDFVWEELGARNGAQDVGEPAVVGATVRLFDAATNALLGTTLTDATGHYLFDNLAPGSFYVIFDMSTATSTGVAGAHSNPALYEYTTPNATGVEISDSDPDSSGRTAVITLVAGQHDSRWDAGIAPVLAPPANPASLGDYTWIDLNGDGKQTAGEPVLAGVGVTLLDDQGFAIRSTTTNAVGFYEFLNLDPTAAYRLLFSPPPGYRLTKLDSTDAGGADDTKDSDADPLSGLTASIAPLGANNRDPNWDGGFIPTFSIGNVVWQDTNDNGSIDSADPSERGIAGVTVKLFALDGVTEISVGPDGVLGTADDAAGGVLTTANGFYLFTGLPAGDYIVAVTKPLGYSSSVGNGFDPTLAGATHEGAATPDEDTTPIDGDDNGSFDALTSTVRSKPVTLAYGSEPTAEPLTPGWPDATPDTNGNYQVDFGFFRTLELGNFVWIDADGNGSFDAGELAVDGATVRLFLDGDGNGVADSATPLVTSKTDSFGHYLFSGLMAGGYVVEVDNRTPTLGGVANPLRAAVSTLDTAGSALPNSNLDMDDNGVTQTTTGIRSGTISLALDDEKTGEIDPAITTDDGDSNLTVDFGFLPTYDLALAKTVTQTSVSANGNAVTWNVRVVNQGQAASGTFTVVDNLPTGITFGSCVLTPATVAGTSCTSSGGVVTAVWAAADQIGPGAAATMTIGTTVGDITKAPFRNWAEISADSGDDIDSTPNGSETAPNNTIGQDQTKPNDRYVSITDLTTINTNDLSLLDEDDNDDASISADLYSLGNYVWADTGVGAAFNNGRLDSTEVGVAGVAVELYKADAAGAPIGAAVLSSVTDSTGRYRFDGLFTDRYVVLVTQANFAAAGPLAGYLSSGPTTSSTGNTTDSRDNGINNPTPATGGVRSAFVNLGTDPMPTSEDQTSPLAGSVAGTGGDGGDTKNNLTLDFGFVPALSLGDFVWIDANHNGIQDSGEVGIDNVAVELLDGAGVAVPGKTTTTATIGGRSGSYSFTALSPGSYKVRFTLPSGYRWTTAGAGVDRANDANPTYVTDTDATVTTATVVLSATPIADTNGNPLTLTDPTIDAGVYRVYAIGDYVWTDSNADGRQTEATPVNGVRVTLLAPDGTTPAKNALGLDVVPTFTNAAGHYVFDNLLPGSYVVQFSTSVAGALWTNALAGSDRAIDSNVTVAATGKTSVIVLDATNSNLRAPVAADGVTVATLIDPTIDAGMIVPVTVGNYVWIDSNHDGIQNEPVSAGVNGVTATLYAANGITPITTDAYGTVIGSKVTTNDAAGNPGYYSFANLLPGSYVVKFTTLPAGLSPTRSNVGADNLDSDGLTAASTVLMAGESDMTLDLGLFAPVSVGDYVWEDVNGNGIQDEPVAVGINGVTATLYAADGTTLVAVDADGQSIIPAITANGGSGNPGYYSFANLLPGQYVVKFTTIPAGYMASDAGVGSDRATDSNGLTATSGLLGAGQSDSTLDAGFYRPASLGDYVWLDTNEDGQQSPGESKVPGVVIQLRDEAGTVIATTTSDVAGAYSFTGLKPGTYTIRAVEPSDMLFTIGTVGSPITDSNINIVTGLSLPITLTSGQFDPTIDVGLVIPGAVLCTAFSDANGNGLRDPAEKPLADVTVSLVNASGQTVSERTSSATGDCTFPKVRPGEYSIIEKPLQNYRPTGITSVKVSVRPGGSSSISFGNKAGSLPITGTDIGNFGALAALLLLAGVPLIASHRRRRM